MSQMNRRNFLTLGLGATALAVTAKNLVGIPQAAAADAPKITEKDILKEGVAAAVANYCEHPEKQPNKFCPDYPKKPGNCNKCMFFNKDNSLTTFKGKQYARCQLLADPKKAQFVSEGGYCATFVQKT